MLNEIDMYRGDNPRFSQEEIQLFRDGSDPWRYPDTDWFSEVLRPWSSQNYANVTISGGTESIKYFLLAGVRDQQGYYRNSATNYRQYDFRSNIDGRISRNVTVGFDISGRQENRNYPTRGSGSIFRMVMRGKPHMHAFWPDGTPGPDIEYGDNPAVVSTDATGYDRDNRYILNNNLRLDINIPFVPGLTINSNAGIDKEFHHRKIFATPWYLYSWDYQTYDDAGNPVLSRGMRGFTDARLTQSMADRQNILVNTFVNYERVIGELHGFKVMAGAERRTGRDENFNAFRRFFVSTAVDQMFAGGEQDMNTGGVANQSARLNYFGRVNYNYMEKYLAEFVWRYDGSYIFPEDRRYGFFPGVSLGWRVSEEDFWKNNINFIDNLKLRGSWGQTGNDRIDEFQYLASYTFGRWDARNWSSQYFRNQPYIFGVDQENKALYEALIPNRNVTWEVATQRNVGIEMSMLNGRLFLEADYFNNVRSEILWWRNASIPGSTGLSLPRENIGRVGNRGFDFNLGYNDQAGDFRYQISLNGGYAKNEILFWDEAPGAPEYQLSTGSPMFTSLYYNAIGIFRNQEDLDNYPHWSGAQPGDIIFEDVNQDGVIDANDRVRNQFNNIPRYTGGLNINMQYRGFDLAILFQGAAGAVQYISTESGEIGNYLQSFAENRWTPENPNASGPRTFNRGNEYWMNNANTHFLHRTDYVRLKNLQFGYNLPATITERIGMQGLRVYVGGFNLLTYAPDFKDFDPEMTSAAGTAYPLQKVVNGGLTLTF
jgi:TonB-linked SusC/RagA family outer membrane protein